MVDVSPNTGLAPARQALVEIDVLSDSRIRVIIGALRSSGLAQHIRQKGAVARLLSSHELKIRAVLRSKAGVDEVLIAEDGDTVVEKIELDPLLVETQLDRVEVKVALDHIARLRAVCAKTASGSVRRRLNLSQTASRVVIGL